MNPDPSSVSTRFGLNLAILLSSGYVRAGKTVEAKRVIVVKAQETYSDSHACARPEVVLLTSIRQGRASCRTRQD
jgi:hypothetical protein